MRVVLFPASYAPVVGGLQTVVQSLAKYLKQQEHDLRVITNRYPVSLPASECMDGIEVNRLLLIKPEIDQLRRNRADLFLGSLYYGRDSHSRLRKIFRDFRPEVVNVHFPDRQIPFILKLRKQFEFRLVVSLHGSEVESAFSEGDSGNGNAGLTKFAIALGAILKEADAVTAVSQHVLNRACVIEPAIGDKSQVIFNGVDPARFHQANAYAHPRPYILGLGRLTHNKGFDLLLEAYAGVSNRDVDLIIAGDGEEREALKNQAKKLGLTDTVHFFGQASTEQVVELLNGCFGVAVPSRTEGFGIVALEAIAAGKPVFATETGGLREFLGSLANGNHENGGSLSGYSAGCPKITLVKPAIDAMAVGLNQLLESRPNGSAKRNGYELPDAYTVQNSCANYERVLLN